jgi:hypothetical protein
MGIWNSKADSERDRWTLNPFSGLGPLRFGASHDEVVEVLGEAGEHLDRGDSVAGKRGWAEFRETGLTAYYRHGRLTCVAVDALAGPQVSVNGMKLVGRVPSELDAAIDRYLDQHDATLSYECTGAPSLAELGLLIRTQRAGDIVLTRPVFVEESDAVFWDVVPEREWNRF